MQRNLADWERLASIGLGTALIATAVARRRSLGPMSLAGAALVARGATGTCPLYKAAGVSSRETGRPALVPAPPRQITESVSISRSARDVFDFWREPENLISIFKGIEHIERVGDRYSRWSWCGPGGVRFQWMAEMAETPPDRLSWRSLPDADLNTSGIVRFEDLERGGCEVTVTMTYNQPGGSAATAALWMMGRTPIGELREDLRRLKQVLEAGEIPIGGEPSGRRTAKFRAAQAVAS